MTVIMIDISLLKIHMSTRSILYLNTMTQGLKTALETIFRSRSMSKLMLISKLDLPAEEKEELILIPKNSLLLGI
jgi:hypothetical protein